MLKAVIVKRTKQPPPYIHDLRRLAEIAGLNFTAQQGNELDVITTFNVRTRYNDVKRTFSQKATSAYTERYLGITEGIYTWLRKELRSKR